MSRIKASLLISLLLLLALFGVAFAYATSVVVTAPNGDPLYEFFFLGVETNPDNTTTWQYAVSGSYTDGYAGLSHTTLGLDLEACLGENPDVLIAPATNTYDTPETNTIGDPNFCSDRAAAGYPCQAAAVAEVEIGNDAALTAPFYGIKYGDVTPQLSDTNNATHILEYTLDYPDIIGEVQVAAKYGTTDAVGVIGGPSCFGSPAAISLSSMSANNDGSTGIFMMSLALLVGLLVTGAAIWRRQTAA